MSKVRVYELAKELGLENRAVLTICDNLGIDGKKSHSSTLSDDEAEKIRRSVIRDAVSEKGGLVREIERGGSILTERRQGNVIIRRKRTPEEEAALAAEEEAKKEVLNLNDVQAPTMVFQSLAPDLAQERNDRDAALARANALFNTPRQEVPAPEVKEETLPVEESVEESAPSPSEAEPESPVVEDVVVEVMPVVKERETVAERPTERPRVFIRERRPAPVVQEEVAPEPTPEVSIEELRAKHDIRAPKILGKIELPTRPEPQKTEKEKERREGVKKEAVVGEESDGSPRGGKAKKKGQVLAEGELDGDVRKPRRKKQIIREDDFVDYDGEKDGWRTRKDKKSKKAAGDEQDARAQVKRQVKIDNEISVGEFAKSLGAKLTDVMMQLMNLGITATVNQLIDIDTAQLVAAEFGATVVNVGQDDVQILKDLKAADDPSLTKLRPPVVTVMGHVDHGKTSLLDAIRKTAVTASEAGGITQHIGAYNVPLATGGSVTFLDTPGHEAFTAMRSRGAKVTDIVVLVVAADDGVMPQTVEALNHAKAAGVPVIVAVNKMDKEGANPDRIKTQLSEHGLVSEDWGGETIMVQVSAHTKQNLDLLLENLYAQAEIMDLKANPDRPAVGAVVEAKLDKGRGPILTVLVQNGTLKKGDPFLCGAVYGKVRALVGSDGKPVDSVGPGFPAEVVGASSPGQAGDDFFVMPSEQEAREFAERRAQVIRAAELGEVSGPLTLDSFAARVAQGDIKELPVIVKGDVHGSIEAIADALGQLATGEVKVKVLHKGVGAITENDVQLAGASNAVILGFGVRAEPRAAQLAEATKTHIVYSRIIYELLEKVKGAMSGMLEPELKETALGRVEVRQTFKLPKSGIVAGSYVLDGIVQRGAQIRLLRDNRVVHEGKMAGLRRFKDDVREVAAGYECGITIDGYSDVHIGDIIEVYKIEQIQRSL